MARPAGWREARRTWLCQCPCGKPDHLIPATHRYFVCDGVRFCGDCARAHVVGPCAELLKVGELA